MGSETLPYTNFVICKLCWSTPKIQAWKPGAFDADRSVLSGKKLVPLRTATAETLENA